jgi:zinc D-Ala-D-Ala carboxypeptidase
MLSDHISYADAIHSDIAKRNGINNYFTPDQLSRMIVLAKKVYEPLISHFNTPIYISSFFRNKEVNTLLGGATSSQHMANNGAAMDIDSQTGLVSNKQIFDYIKDNLEFDQLIWEAGNEYDPDWVHVSYNEGHNRKEILKMIRVDGKSTYVQYT